MNYPFEKLQKKRRLSAVVSPAWRHFRLGLAALVSVKAITIPLGAATLTVSNTKDSGAHGGGIYNAGTLVATTSRGDHVNRAHSANYRIETAEALSFLNDVIRRANAGEL